MTTGKNAHINQLKINKMEKQKKYRIVCDMEGRFTVQEAVTRDDYRKEWMTVYNCENKNEAGLNEARQWIDTEGGHGRRRRMITIDHKRKYYFLVEDMYKQLVDVFHTHEVEEFTLDDYYWWAEFIVCRMLRNLDEGREILNEIEGEEASDETA